MAVAACAQPARPAAGPDGAGAGATAPAAAPAPQHLRVGVAGVSAALAPVWIAAKGGLFQRYGLDVQPEVLQGGTPTIQGLLGGDYQFIETSGVDLLSARLGGADVRILGVHINTLPYSIVAGPEISEPTALRGKRIAVSRVGTSSDFAVRYALDRIGLHADSDVTIVGTGNQATRFAALKGGSVDAAVVSPPLNVLASKLGLREVVSLSGLGVEYAHEAVATSGDYLKAHPETADAFLKGYVESLYLWKADPARTKELLADYLAFDPSAQEEAQSLDETWIAYRDLLPDVPRPTWAGLDLIFKERPAGTDENSGAGYAGLVDEGPLNQLESSGFFDQMRAEYPR
ncbi:MAG TPA: ABC transporter substrate-binding protein [Chloroflexota bacterium]|nr:ABC transporter substrate-binding protein [Chloroflexota bacterium]